MVELLLISNGEVGATSGKDGPEREYKAHHKPLRSKRRKEIGLMTKVLIEDGMRVRKLLGPQEWG